MLVSPRQEKNLILLIISDLSGFLNTLVSIWLLKSKTPLSSDSSGMSVIKRNLTPGKTVSSDLSKSVVKKQRKIEKFSRSSISSVDRIETIDSILHREACEKSLDDVIKGILLLFFFF